MRCPFAGHSSCYRAHSLVHAPACRALRRARGFPAVILLSSDCQDRCVLQTCSGFASSKTTLCTQACAPHGRARTPITQVGNSAWRAINRTAPANETGGGPGPRRCRPQSPERCRRSRWLRFVEVAAAATLRSRISHAIEYSVRERSARRVHASAPMKLATCARRRDERRMSSCPALVSAPLSERALRRQPARQERRDSVVRPR